MRTLRCLTLFLGCLLLAAPVFAADDADAVLGKWLTADSDAQVEIVKDGDAYDGRIVWLKEPMYPTDDTKGMAGQAKVDRENPDAALKTRPIIGLPLITGFKYAGDGVWNDGTIYDPKSGGTYSCKMTLMMDGSLKVRGYKGISLFGRTEIWTRPAPEATPAPATSSHRG